MIITLSREVCGLGTSKCFSFTVEELRKLAYEHVRLHVCFSVAVVSETDELILVVAARLCC